MYGARRCVNCGLSYPANQAANCPICFESTVYSTGYFVSPDWEERVAAAVEARELEIEADELIQTVRTTLMDEGGDLFLSTHDVVRSGIQRRLQTFDIVRISSADGTDRYVEVVAYSYEGRRYLVRPFSIEFSKTVPKAWLPKRRRKKAG